MLKRLLLLVVFGNFIGCQTLIEPRRRCEDPGHQLGLTMRELVRGRVLVDASRRAPTPGRADGHDRGRVLVHRPAPSARRRLRGKQPPALPVQVVQVPKPREAAQPQRLHADELNDEEAVLVEGLHGVARN